MRTNAYPGDPSHGKLRDMRLGPPPIGLVAAAVMAVLAGACGDDAPPVINTGDILEDLRALPGVASVEVDQTNTAGYRFYILQFDQPVDHADPDGPHFLQKVSLMHFDVDAPMVAYTSGYWDYYEDRIVELTALLSANQISIEHRYFAGSRPDPADWSKLTIEQMAHDQHAIIAALRRVYSGAFVTAGASKGGMTAIYHRRFYPDDVEGTVPYVAPISFGAPDPRYTPYLDTLGPTECRQAIRNVAVELLANRRAMLIARAMMQAQTDALSYTRIELEPAVESAVLNLEWSFWQYYGVGFCADVPATTATDDEMWTFLDDFSPVADNTDARIAQFDAYYYQAYFQLGYPEGGAAYLDPYLQFSDADYLDALPTEQPTYDGGAAMNDIDQWVRGEGNRLLFIYGQWDPWTGGQFQLGNATESAIFTQVEGSHASRITRLSTADRDAAFALLESWTGVTPKLPPQGRATATARASRDQLLRDALDGELRVPSALVRALSFRRESP
jgi:hypothetical protein